MAIVTAATASVVLLDPCLAGADAARDGRPVRTLRPVPHVRRARTARHRHRPRARAAPRRAHELPAHRRPPGREPSAALAVRTSYFREEYAYGTDERIAGIGPFLHHPGVRRRGARDPRPAGRRTRDRVREPDGPGPGARGAHRRAGVPRREPQARPAVVARRDAPLGLVRGVPHADRDGDRVVPRLRRRRARVLARRRRPVPRRATAVRFNTAMVLDTDSVFHGVDRIADVAADDLPRIRPGTTLDFAGDRTLGRCATPTATSSRATTGSSCASRCRGRRTASATSTSATRGATTATISRSTSSSIVSSTISSSAVASTRDVARDAELGLLADRRVHRASRFPHRRPQVDPLAIHSARVVRSHAWASWCVSRTTRRPSCRAPTRTSRKVR